MLRSACAFMLTLLLAAPAFGAAPATLAYQGRLANASGQPINGTLAITFRLYDVASGGTALWTEVQTGVEVDAGNLTVALGSVSPLPSDIWGRQLWLGVQIAGDSEMLPRPPLTAAPFALRAAGTMLRTVVVSAEGTALENGAALLAAVTAVGTPSAAAPRTIELDAGVFDLGSLRLELPSHTTLVGRGEGATLITSGSANGTVLLASHSHVRQLTARNTGTPATDNDSTFGIGAAGPNRERVQGVSLQQVTGEAIGAAGTPGARQGLYLCTADSVVRHATGRGVGGNYSFGLRSDCGNAHESTGLHIDGLRLFASGGGLGLRGAYLAGGGHWRGIAVRMEVNHSSETNYGLRIWPGADGAAAEVTDLSVHISGGDLATPTANILTEAVRLENGVAITFHQARLEIDRVRSAFASGIRHFGDDSNTAVVRWHDLDLRMATLTDAAASAPFTSHHGLRLFGASPELHRSRLRVSCLAGSVSLCTGIRRELPPGSPNTATTALQAGPLRLEQVSVEVGHVDPADAGAQSIGYEGLGPVRMVDSTLRVVLSPDAEQHTALGLTGTDPNVQVIDSRLELVHPTQLDGGCVLRGNAAGLELFDSYFEGHGCTNGVPLACSGNTKRGTGFLAGSCP